MKFMKSLLYKCLCINNVHKINYNTITLFEKNDPIKYYSFKKTKKYYFENNLYYDLYKETPSINNNLLADKYNSPINYKKYTDLTAEHICPQSYLKKHPQAKFDMHNIFLTLKQINCNRSNYKYTDEYKFFNNIDNIYYFLDNNSKLTKYDSENNYKNNKLKLFIPYANSRGTIARSIAYMKVKYKNIILEDIIDLDVLLYWNYLYPPTEIEYIKNYKIREIQGNSNYFIEKPELMDYYFDK